MPSRKQKKYIRRLIFSVLAAVALGMAIWMAVDWYKYRRVKFRRYPEFGISIPESYSIHGIDVSRFQYTIAWDEVKLMQVKDVKLGFSFIKATEGIGNLDPQYKRNWKKARDNGIVRGAYHFYIGSKDGRMQAENFIRHVDLDPGDLPPVLDAEQLNGTNAIEYRKGIKAWLDIVENYYHVRPIIYTNVDFYNRVLGSEFDQYPLWVAHYYQAHQPRIRRGWVFWQHSDEGRVNGIVSKVDFNVFSGDSLEFRSILVP